MRNKYNVGKNRWYLGRKYASELEAGVAFALDSNQMTGLWFYEFLTLELRGRYNAPHRYRPDFVIQVENPILEKLVKDRPANPAFPGIKYIVEAKGMLTPRSKAIFKAYSYRQKIEKLPPLIVASQTSIYSWELVDDYLERVK